MTEPQCDQCVYLAKLLRRASDYLNGEEKLSNKQLEYLARTLKVVTTEKGPQT